MALFNETDSREIPEGAGVRTTGVQDDGALIPGAHGAPGERPRAIPVVETPLPPPAGWGDTLTGTDGPRYWDRVIFSESARYNRYKRPATVVLVEITGLDSLARHWGPEVAQRTLVVAARRLAKEVRPSDHIARIEPARFGIILTETNEITAINFVERVRAECEREVRVASELVGVAFGWASPPAKGDLSDALGLAGRRLETEIRGVSG